MPRSDAGPETSERARDRARVPSAYLVHIHVLGHTAIKTISFSLGQRLFVVRRCHALFHARRRQPVGGDGRAARWCAWAGETCTANLLALRKVSFSWPRVERKMQCSSAPAIKALSAAAVLTHFAKRSVRYLRICGRGGGRGGVRERRADSA
jgi:hypothetical protein